MRHGGLFTRQRAAVIAAVFAFVIASCMTAGQSAPSIDSSRVAFTVKLVAAAIERTHHSVRYDPAYVRIPYPNGDVPADTGVCTDEIVRIYRAVGIDLQKEVHEDMQANFWSYPKSPSLATLAHRYEYRSPPGAEPDGFFQP